MGNPKLVTIADAPGRFCQSRRSVSERRSDPRWVMTEASECCNDE